MKLLRSLLLTLVFMFATLVASAPLFAATTNYSTAVPGVVTIPIQLSGQYTADVTAVARFQLPFAANVIGVTASARASGGTTPTLTVDLLDDGTTVLSSPVAVTAGSVAEATISAASVVDESVMTINLAIGGTTPTWDDITILVTVVRR